MPLDSTNKINHIQAVVLKSFKGRQRNVTFVYFAAGVYTYTLVSVIMRPEQVIDPQIFDPSGGQPSLSADQQMVAPIGTNFVGVVFVADTTTNTAVGVAAALKYEIIEALPAGIVPGGTHIRVLLRRMR